MQRPRMHWRMATAWHGPTDNTEVIAFAKQNTGYTVGIPSLGSQDTIAPAVSQGNTTVLDWLNEEIKALGEENFFHKDYEETLVDTYGLDYEDELVVEGGVTGGAAMPHPAKLLLRKPHLLRLLLPK